MLEATTVGGSGASTSVLFNEPSTSTIDIVGGFAIPPTLSAIGKEQVTCLPSSDDSEYSNSKPPAPLTWCSRPYAQPILNEEMMTDAL